MEITAMPRPLGFIAGAVGPPIGSCVLLATAMPSGSVPVGNGSPGTRLNVPERESMKKALTKSVGTGCGPLIAWSGTYRNLPEGSTARDKLLDTTGNEPSTLRAPETASMAQADTCGGGKMSDP